MGLNYTSRTVALPPGDFIGLLFDQAYCYEPIDITRTAAEQKIPAGKLIEKTEGTDTVYYLVGRPIVVDAGSGNVTVEALRRGPAIVSKSALKAANGDVDLTATQIAGLAAQGILVKEGVV